MFPYIGYYLFLPLLLTSIFNLYIAQVPGTTQDHLQIFNIEAKAKLKSHQMPEQVSIETNSLYTLSDSDFTGLNFILDTNHPFFVGCFLEMDYTKDVGAGHTNFCVSLVD